MHAQLSIEKRFVSEANAKSTVSDIYELLVENHISGIPVLDEGNHFIGMMEKNKIEQAVIMRFLASNAKQTDKAPNATK